MTVRAYYKCFGQSKLLDWNENEAATTEDKNALNSFAFSVLS